jgi:heterotetrameric sarcosine oxidase gamma subunit
MRDFSPLARSPIPPAPPVTILEGWEVSRRQTSAALRLSDLTACTKLLLRGPHAAAAVANLPPLGAALRGASGWLTIAFIPHQWLLLGGPGAAAPALSASPNGAALSSPPAITDLTHARVALRLAGADSARLLSKLCAIDFESTSFPDLRALRSSVAKVPCDIVRHDIEYSAGPSAEDNTTTLLSYLILCDRPAGKYIFDALIDAGQEYKIDIEGFSFSS